MCACRARCIIAVDFLSRMVMIDQAGHIKKCNRYSFFPAPGRRTQRAPTTASGRGLSVTKYYAETIAL